MDAIIFFCKKRDLTAWRLRPLRVEDYLLLKVEVNAERGKWFGAFLPAEPNPPGEPAPGGWFKRRRMRRAAKKEYRRRQQEYAQAVLELERALGQMAGEILAAAERAGAREELSCVYDGELRFFADEETLMGRLWRGCWNIPEFQGYSRIRWMKPLLGKAGGPHFVLLGLSPDLPALLEQCARRMKSVCWYLPEEQWTEETEELAEEFYMENGLAITVYPLGNRRPYRALRFPAAGPVCVFDFSEEEKVSAGELAPGSIWLDFASVEEKERRIRRLCPGVRYDSLKMRWREVGSGRQIGTNFSISDNSEKFPEFL